MGNTLNQDDEEIVSEIKTHRQTNGRMTPRDFQALLSHQIQENNSHSQSDQQHEETQLLLEEHLACSEKLKSDTEQLNHRLRQMFNLP